MDLFDLDAFMTRFCIPGPGRGCGCGLEGAPNVTAFRCAHANLPRRKNLP
jgi:hypothetical protein